MLWQWKGLWPYGEALKAQRDYRQKRLAGEVPDMLWLLEHPPVLTGGRRAEPLTSIPSGYELFSTERGGLYTCHEPGQLVGYLLMDASRLGPKKLVAAVETGLISWLNTQGIKARVDPKHPGVWVDSPVLAKIAAIGLHLEHQITMHGFALNLCNSLQGFQQITPCGIQHAGVTSLHKLSQQTLSPEQAASSVAKAILQALDNKPAFL
jgi:lipoyl(octanoyl) transferase